VFLESKYIGTFIMGVNTSCADVGVGVVDALIASASAS